MPEEDRKILIVHMDNKWNMESKKFSYHCRDEDGTVIW